MSFHSNPRIVSDDSLLLCYDMNKKRCHSGNLAVNGKFDDDEKWTKGSNWTISGGTASHTSGAAGDLYQNAARGKPNDLVSGRLYICTYTISGYSAGDIRLVLGGTNGTYRGVTGGNQTWTEWLTCGSSNTNINFYAHTAFVGSIDNVIVSEAKIYNLADSATYANMSPHTTSANNKPYIDFITTGPKYVKITEGDGTNNTGNFLVGAGDLATGVNNAFTTMGWMLRDSSDGGTLMAYRRHSFQLRIRVYNGSIYFSQRNVASPYTTYDTYKSVTNSLNVWDHYALVKADGQTPNDDKWTFFKNGESLGTNTFEMNETISSSTYYDIGADWSDDDYIGNNMGGYIGPTLHYNRALTDEEVRQNFNAHRARFGK